MILGKSIFSSFFEYVCSNLSVQTCKVKEEEEEEEGETRRGDCPYRNQDS